MGEIIQFPGAQQPERRHGFDNKRMSDFARSASEEMFDEYRDILSKPNLSPPSYVRYATDIITLAEIDKKSSNAPGEFTFDQSQYAYNEPMLKGLREYAHLSNNDIVTKAGMLDKYFILSGFSAEIIAQYSEKPKASEGRIIECGDMQRLMTPAQFSRFQFWRAAGALALPYVDEFGPRIKKFDEFLSSAQLDLFEGTPPELLGLLIPFKPEELDDYLVSPQPGSNVVNLFGKK